MRQKKMGVASVLKSQKAKPKKAVPLGLKTAQLSVSMLGDFLSQ